MLPKFLIKPIPKQKNITKIRQLLADPSLHTVCESAKCPNIGECFSQNTLTFMILGNICTRNCRFCGITSGQPLPPDPQEPKKIAQATQRLGLSYVVITSVTRDDLPDGGASHFAAVIKQLKSLNITVEVLVPDFLGDVTALNQVIWAQPYVLNHNIETVLRLYALVRPQASYQRSLNLLKLAKDSQKIKLYTKSGFMVGLGEKKEEVFATLHDLADINCDFVTIGQYLPPSREHIQPERYVTPEEFEEYKRFGQQVGISKVFAGPFVRSSYHAALISDKLENKNK